jgi:glycosyltransferase involved in cell wall biosynthesis
MRIGIDAHAAEQDGSGNCTHVRGLISALLALDSENDYVLYIIDRSHKFYKELAPPPHVRLRELRIHNPVLRIPLLLGPSTYADRLDVLHVQYIAPPVHRGKLIATVHDLSFLHLPEVFSRLFVWRSKILVRQTVRRAARIITVSNFSKQDIIGAYGADAAKVEVIPNGVAPVFFEPPDPARIRETLARCGVRIPYILSVGRLNPRKNLVPLVRAFRRLKKDGRLPHQLVIAGKSDYASDRIVAAIKRFGGRDVVLTGFVPDPYLPSLYKAADIFIFPSLYEGMGLPVVEAMASGVPVITSALSALPETAGDAALIINPQSEEAIAESILRMAVDSSLKDSYRKKGRLRAREFTWEAAASRTLEIYRDIAKPAQ